MPPMNQTSIRCARLGLKRGYLQTSEKTLKTPNPESRMILRDITFEMSEKLLSDYTW
jgi:hypothetical protein